MGSDPIFGTVYLVGAGPGDPELLTLRAARLLAEADVVFHDALVPEPILGLASMAETIAVGKRCGRHSVAQRFINKRLADAARRYRTVVRLKGGDPMLFGRAHEEIAHLRACGIAVEVVPGVTSALAAAAELQASLTQRGVARSVVFATTRAAQGEAPSDWVRAVAAADTAVLYMAAGDAPAARQALIAAGKPPDTPVALAESVSLPEQSLVSGNLEDLERLAARLGGGPALVLIGAVLGQAESKQFGVRARTRLVSGTCRSPRESAIRALTPIS